MERDFGRPSIEKFDMRKSSLLLIGLGVTGLFLLICGLFALRLRGQYLATFQTVDVEGKKLRLELVSRPEELRRGLSDRKSMKDDEGMLFLMGETGRYPFWMNRMYFALDMVYLQDGKVVDIGRNVPAPTSFLVVPETFYPKEDANQVLELTAGGAERYRLEVGKIVPEIGAIH